MEINIYDSTFDSNFKSINLMLFKIIIKIIYDF